MTKLKKIKFLFIFSFFFIVSGCLYYDYGVDKETVKLPYRTYYHSEKDERYDFNTVLYSKEEVPKGEYNYIDFVVRISHLYKEIHENKNKGKYISEISFSNFTTDDDIRIDVNSIKLTHENSKGEEIPFSDVEHDFDRQLKTKYRNHFYRKIYNPDDLTKSIKEYIYLEIYIDGTKKIVEYEFPIKKKLHYTWWDVMMGI